MYRICISPNYTGAIQNEITFKEYFDDLNGCYDDILNLFVEEDLRRNSIEAIEAEIFQEASGVNGLAESLGKAIKTLMEKVAEFFNKIFGSFSKEEREYKATVDRINKELKDNPSLRNQALQGLSSGLITTKEIQDMNNLDREFNQLMLEKNPKTFQGKLKKLKMKWDDPENTKTVKRVKAVSAVVSLGTALVVLGPKIAEALESSRKANENDQKTLAKMYDDVQNTKDGDPQKLSFMKEKILAYQWKHGKTADYYATLQGDYKKLNLGMKALLAVGGKDRKKPTEYNGVTYAHKAELARKDLDAKRKPADDGGSGGKDDKGKGKGKGK